MLLVNDDGAYVMRSRNRNMYEFYDDDEVTEDHAHCLNQKKKNVDFIFMLCLQLFLFFIYFFFLPEKLRIMMSHFYKRPSK